MANTYIQMYDQFVFAVKGRRSIIPKEYKEEINKYITGIISKRGQKLLAINCMPDHTHIFIRFKPTIILSDLMRDIKTASSSFIKDNRFSREEFNWQEGYGAFTYSHSQIDNDCKYIQNQEKHHKKKSFQEEYLEFLKKFDIDYNEKYLFDWIK